MARHLEFTTYDFRHAHEILVNRGTWAEVQNVITSLTDEEIIDRHREVTAQRRAVGRKSPAGAQTVINALLKERFHEAEWESEAHLFEAHETELRKWRMDFYKDRVGVEATFNHAEAIAWQFTKLNMAGESDRVTLDHRIHVGIVIAPSTSLKSWGRMDNAVTTAEMAELWLSMMKPIMPIPILIAGLATPEWPAVEGVFRGTGGDEFDPLTEATNLASLGE